MTTDQFCYWLQGYFEMSEETHLSANQIQMIKDHLQLVFEKKTPTRIVCDKPAMPPLDPWPQRPSFPYPGLGVPPTEPTQVTC